MFTNRKYSTLSMGFSAGISFRPTKAGIFEFEVNKKTSCSHKNDDRELN